MQKRCFGMEMDDAFPKTYFSISSFFLESWEDEEERREDVPILLICTFMHAYHVHNCHMTVWNIVWYMLHSMLEWIPLRRKYFSRVVNRNIFYYSKTSLFLSFFFSSLSLSFSLSFSSSLSPVNRLNTNQHRMESGRERDRETWLRKWEGWWSCHSLTVSSLSLSLSLSTEGEKIPFSLSSDLVLSINISFSSCLHHQRREKREESERKKESEKKKRERVLRQEQNISTNCALGSFGISFLLFCFFCFLVSDSER